MTQLFRKPNGYVVRLEILSAYPPDWSNSQLKYYWAYVGDCNVQEITLEKDSLSIVRQTENCCKYIEKVANLKWLGSTTLTFSP